MFQIQYKKLGELNWLFVQSLSKPLSLMPLMNGETYQLQLRAALQNQVSPWSELFTFTMPGPSCQFGYLKIC